MDHRFTAHAEEVSTIFRRREHKRTSWDPVKDRERAKMIRILRLPEEKVEPKAMLEQEQEEDRAY